MKWQKNLKIDFAPFIPMIQATIDKLKRPQ
jgi:hypothetical protein